MNVNLQLRGQKVLVVVLITGRNMWDFWWDISYAESAAKGHVY